MSTGQPINLAVVVDGCPDREKERCSDCCCSQCCRSYSDKIDVFTSSSQVIILRSFGTTILICSIVELGLGSASFGFLSNMNLGSWWVGILGSIAGICAIVANKRGWVAVTCFFSSLSFAVATIGTFYDSTNYKVFSTLVACTSRNSDLKISHYGTVSNNNFVDSHTCMNSASAIVTEGCYCVRQGGVGCAQYTLSSFAKFHSRTCDNVFTTYPDIFISSAAFCLVIALLSLILSVFSLTLLTPSSLLAIGGRRKLTYAEEKITVGIKKSQIMLH
jgi:hypothetical protein